MFNNLKNIIIGDSNVGKSTYLYQLANLLSDSCSVCLIDGDGSGIEHDGLSNDIVHLHNKHDVRLFKMINEIDNIDVILIDDIKFLSPDSLLEVTKSKKIIIATNYPIDKINPPPNDGYKTLLSFLEKSEIFNLTKTTISVNDSIIDRNGFLNKIKRELKLNILLDEKQR